MKKRRVWDKIRYKLDYLMSRGPITMILLLFAVTVTAVFLIGLVAFFVGDGESLPYHIWMSLMHTLDAGNLAGNSTMNIPYLLMMFLATLCGMLITSGFVGILASGVEDKLRSLRKGNSVVQEDGHTVIIGFDENIFSLLRELIEANRNHNDSCIVILGEQDKEKMEEEISSYIPDTGTTRVICRSGSLFEAFSFARCSVETSKSVILNTHEDAKTVKVLLALATYIKDKTCTYSDLHFVASVYDKEYLEVAKIASEGKGKIVHIKDFIARIIANTCRQHGVSQVLSELFNFDGNELYYEKIPELTGKTFQQTLRCFSNAVVIGLMRNGESIMNPPMDTIIDQNDIFILLEEDDGAYRMSKIEAPYEMPGCRSVVCNEESNDLLILGSNDKLPMILAEYDEYVKTGTHVIIVDEDFAADKPQNYKNLNIELCTESVTRQMLCEMLSNKIGNVLLLNDDSTDGETSDSQTLFKLILLRDIEDNSNASFSITTEMRSPENRRLASQARVDDFVIGSDFSCLIMGQLSENPNLYPVIEDLLNVDGSELYMKPVCNYVELGKPVNGYTLTESAARKGEIFVGYRCVSKNQNVVVNPQKEDTVIFDEKDLLVVIAEN